MSPIRLCMNSIPGYVHKSTSEKLHVHRISDMDMDQVDDYILEERVVRSAFGW